MDVCQWIFTDNSRIITVKRHGIECTLGCAVRSLQCVGLRGLPMCEQGDRERVCHFLYNSTNIGILFFNYARNNSIAFGMLMKSPKREMRHIGIDSTCIRRTHTHTRTHHSIAINDFSAFMLRTKEMGSTLADIRPISIENA